MTEEFFRKLNLKIARFQGIEKCIIAYKSLCVLVLPWKRTGYRISARAKYLAMFIVGKHSHKHLPCCLFSMTVLNIKFSI